jgi:hypothetical protein
MFRKTLVTLTAAVVLSVSLAAPAAADTWYPYNSYDLFDQCPPDGEFGLAQGWWSAYDCDYGGGQTILWVLVP